MDICRLSLRSPNDIWDIDHNFDIDTGDPSQGHGVILEQNKHKILYNKKIYRKTSNIRHTLVANKIVDHSDVVGASSVGAAPTTSSFST